MNAHRKTDCRADAVTLQQVGKLKNDLKSRLAHNRACVFATTCLNFPYFSMFLLVPLTIAPITEDFFFNSSFAMVLRCTTSGPSASRTWRTCVYKSVSFESCPC